MGKEQLPGVRDRLLIAGVAVFSKRGFNGCSVQDITEQAGVPKGSFYNHFESKEALGAAAIEHYWNDNAAGLLDRLSQGDASPLARLRDYFEQVSVQLTAMDFTCGCLIGNMTAELSDHSAVIAAQLSTVFASWTQRVAACIVEAQAAGEITTDTDPTALATFTLNAWEGALLRARVEKNGRPLQQFAEFLFSQVLR